MKRILFQGDSITDCGRARENDINVELMTYGMNMFNEEVKKRAEKAKKVAQEYNPSYGNGT